METMGIIGFVFGIFGLMAYLQTSSLKTRIASLERELTRLQGTKYHDNHAALITVAKTYVGRQVNLELKEDHEDVDVTMYGNTKHGSNTILDVDDGWMLVRIDTPKGTKEKLLRLESVERISVLAEQGAAAGE